MAQSGYTPIQLYRTTTLGAAPTSGNLAAGELAININDSDMALYAKNNTGTVKRLINNPAGLKYPTADGSSGQVVKTDGSGNLSIGAVSLTAAVTGTLPIANGGTNQTAFTSPASSIAGLVWFDGTSFQNDTTTSHVGYNASTNTFYANNPNFSGSVVIGTLSGLLKGTSGTVSAASAGTDYIAPSGALGTPSSGTLSNCTVDGTNSVGYLNIPQNAQTGSYTLVLADAGKHIYHASGAGSATYTIPANSSVAYAIGTAVTFVNLSSTSISIAITTDTMYLSNAGTTGTRTLAQYGSATAIKVTSTVWLISGSGLT